MAGFGSGRKAEGKLNSIQKNPAVNNYCVRVQFC